MLPVNFTLELAQLELGPFLLQRLFQGDYFLLGTWNTKEKEKN